METKLIDSQSFFNPDELGCTIIYPDDVSGLAKVAADSNISAYVNDVLKPNPDIMYLHINALGAGEYYGANRNGDYFPEANLKEWYKTFETYANSFRHHVNKDPSKGMGKVLFATYNERMHRVELIAEISLAMGRDLESRINQGDFPSTSMACKTPFDVCSICGNKAHTRAEYCSHLTTQLGQQLPDGRKVMAMNVGPLKFFDISIVIRPADITSSVLTKVAGYRAQSSIDAAIDAGIAYVEPHVKEAQTIKQAAMGKLADLVKKVDDGVVVGASDEVRKVMGNMSDPEVSLLHTLSKFPLEESLNAFAELGIAPSVRFLADLIAMVILGDHAMGIGPDAELVALSMSPEHISEDSFNMLDGIKEKPANPVLLKVISASIIQSSVLPEYVEKRASEWYDPVLQKSPTPLFIGDSRKEIEKRLNKTEETSTFKTLMMLGGAAIVGRFYISSLMDDKIDKLRMSLENNKLKSHYRDGLHQRTKIGFNKAASTASEFIDSSTEVLYVMSKEAEVYKLHNVGNDLKVGFANVVNKIASRPLKQRGIPTTLAARAAKRKYTNKFKT